MAILTGFMRLGRDAELKKTANGDSVANLSLAYTPGAKSDDMKDLTVWVDGSLWGKRAEKLAPYLKKGTPVVVVINDPYVRTYQKKDGSHGFSLTGQVIELTFAGKAEQKQETRQEPMGAAVGGTAMDPDLDIPFRSLRRNEL